MPDVFLKNVVCIDSSFDTLFANRFRQREAFGILDVHLDLRINIF